MLDTIQISIPYPVKNIRILSRRVEEINEFNQHLYKGYLENLFIRTSDSHTDIFGSIPKYLRGNNLIPLKYSEILAGFDRIANELDVPVKEGTAMRLDLGLILQLPDQIKSYFGHLSHCPQKVRMQFGNSLYFGKRPLQIICYDKIKEMRSSGTKIPLEFTIDHFMRIEVRCFSKYIRKWADQHNRGNRSIANLFEKDIYEKLVTECKNQILKILWDDLIASNYTEIRTLKNFDHYLISKGIENIGGLQACFDFIDSLQYKDKSFGPTQRSRYKKLLKEKILKFEDSNEHSEKRNTFYTQLNQAFNAQKY